MQRQDKLRGETVAVHKLLSWIVVRE